MEEKLMLAKELAACLGGVEVQMIEANDDETLHRFMEHSVYRSLLPVLSVKNLRMMMASMQPECLYIMGGILDLFYAVIPLRESRFVFAGPCRKVEFSENRIRSDLRPFRLSGSAAAKVIEYCRFQPVLSMEVLHRLGIILCRHVLQLPEPVEYRHIDYRWYQSDQPPIWEPESEASGIHQIEQRYEASAALTEAVKQGNLSLAYSFIQGFQPGMSQLQRNANPLRNAQNICIILNTQLRHALEDCKVHPYLLDKVSGDIALHIETLKSPEAAGKFCAEIVRRYCELANQERYHHLNRLARQAVMHIKMHLGDNLTVKETAAALTVNANYLSCVFHQELGVTFIEFLNRERAQQAAALLRHTNMQIQRIAAAVGYNNTSYFTRQFVRIWGCTPKEYRAKGLF